LIVNWDAKHDGSEMNISVKSESLQSLRLSLKGGHKVNIDALDLKYLFLTSLVLELNLIQSLDSIKEAGIDVEYLHLFANLDDLPSPSLNASKFLYGLQNLRLISLSENIVKV